MTQVQEAHQEARVGKRKSTIAILVPSGIDDGATQELIAGLGAAVIAEARAQDGCVDVDETSLRFGVHERGMERQFHLTASVDWHHEVAAITGIEIWNEPNDGFSPPSLVLTDSSNGPMHTHPVRRAIDSNAAQELMVVGDTGNDVSIDDYFDEEE